MGRITTYWLGSIPWKPTLILFLSSFSHACTFSVMLGYMPDLLHEFGIFWTDVGIYQGQIVGLNSLAYGVFTFLAGFVIDKVGGLQFFIGGTFVQFLVMISSAFICNIPSLYAASFLIGLASCNRLAAKYITLQISSEWNASGVVTYSLWLPSNFGNLLGPSIGGFLALPVVQYPYLFRKGSFVDVFPALLPNLLVATIVLVTLLFSLSMWPTQERREDTVSERLLADTKDHSIVDRNTVGSRSTKNTENICTLENTRWSYRKLLMFMSSRDVVLLLCVTLVSSLTIDTSLNVFSMWVLAPGDEGGMGYLPMQNGQLKLYASVISIAVDLVVPIVILKLLGNVRGLSGSFLVFSISISMLWLPSRLNNQSWRFVLLLGIFLVNRVASTVIGVAYYVIMKNIIPRDIRGRLLSFESCLTMLARSSGHVIFGQTFSWSISNIKETSGNVSFPFNEPFTFYVLSILTLFGAIFSIFFTNEAERSPVEQIPSSSFKD